MKVFITGSTGFLGTYFARRMAQTDHELYCLVRKTSKVDHLREIGANLVYGDVTDRQSVLEGMRGCDWVAHLAGIYSFWEPDKRVFTDVNITGTRNVMESALEAGASKVAHVSTIAVYGRPEGGYFNGGDVYRTNLRSDYSRSKYAGDMICWELYEKQGLPVVMIYPGSILGAGDTKPSGEYIDNIIGRKLYVSILANYFNTYVHVDDVAEAILRALEKTDNIGEKYPVGNCEMTWGELNKLISEVSGIPEPAIHVPDPLLTYFAVWSTWFAELSKLPPLLGLSIGTVGTIKQHLLFDGGKAERELGITYAPILTAMQEKVAAHKARSG